MAGARINLPPILRLDGDPFENWIRFTRQFKEYLRANASGFDVSTKTIEERRAISKTKAKLLLNLAGEKATDLATSFGLEDKDLDDFDTLLTAFDNYFLPNKDYIYDRLEFSKYVQQEGETFDEFLSEAKRLLKSCGYDYFIPHDSILRNKIVTGIHDKKVRKRLMQIRGLTLEDAIRHCREAEQAEGARHSDLCTVLIKEEQSDTDSVLDMTSAFSARGDKESESRKRDLSGIRKPDNASKTKRMLLEDEFQRHDRSHCNGTKTEPGPSRLSSSDDKIDLIFRSAEYVDEKMRDLPTLSSFPCERARNQMCSDKDSEDASFDCDDEDFSESDEFEESESDSALSEEDPEGCDHSGNFYEAGEESGARDLCHESTTSGDASHIWGPCVGVQPYLEYTGCEQVYLREERNNMKPADLYQVFVSDEIIDYMVEEINSNAENLLSLQHRKRPRSVHSWIPTHREEMKTFVGLRIWMSLVQLPRFKNYWSDSVVYQNGVARKAMSRNRFQLLLRFWHSRKRNSDHGGTHIHPILEKLEERFVRAQTPGQRLILDEYVVPANPGFFRQHTPFKSDKLCKKEFRLCDPSGYTYRTMVYSGKGSSEQTSDRIAAQLILNLMEPYLEQGRTLCSDNSYTSMALVQSLLDMKTHFLGTVNQNARGFPEEVMNAKLRKGQVVAMESKLNGATVLKWRDEREIQMVSTEFSAKLISLGRKNRDGEDAMIPVMVLEYNKMRGDADVPLADFLSSFNSAHSASARWHHKLVDDALFCTSLVNAFVIWNKTKPDGSRRMSLLQFGRQVCQQFLNIADDPFERTANPSTHYLGQAQELEGAKTQRKARGRCRGCYKELMKTLDRKKALSKVKRVSTQCITCPDKPYLCMPCFKNIHEGSIMGHS